MHPLPFSTPGALCWRGVHEPFLHPDLLDGLTPRGRILVADGGERRVEGEAVVLRRAGPGSGARRPGRNSRRCAPGL
eukprot:9662729-Alexandrium_andersonii.AAC.1